MVKVYGYRRSGNHLLMATIWHCFEAPDSTRLVYADGLRWYADGKIEAVVPWAELFGGHQRFEPQTNIHEAIYIIRHPMDCLYSNWRSFAPEKTLVEYLTHSKIADWFQHAESYIRAGVWLVRYEDLVLLPLMVLETIERRFRLKRRRGTLALFPGPVGWSPGPGASLRPDGRHSVYRDRYTPELVKKFHDVLGAERYGYVV